MPLSFEWSEEYLIGVEEIDAQHKRFLNLIRQLYYLNLLEPESPRLEHLLDELEKYVLFHIRSEELLMILYSYPQYEKQKKEHKKLAQTVSRKKKMVPQDKASLNDLLIFLMKWFVDHTTCFDKELGHYIKQQRHH